VTSTRSRLRCILDGAERLDVVQPEFIRTALAHLADERKLSGKTLNDYRKSLGAFFSWLELEGRWDTNPVRRVTPVQEFEATRVRRALSNDELCPKFQGRPVASGLP
jgi:site-specific recombinase XerD